MAWNSVGIFTQGHNKEPGVPSLVGLLLGSDPTLSVDSRQYRDRTKVTEQKSAQLQKGSKLDCTCEKQIITKGSQFRNACGGSCQEITTTRYRGRLQGCNSACSQHLAEP